MKFSIRDLMLVTVIVALAVAWWVDRSRLLEDISGLRSEMKFMESKLSFVKSQAEAEAELAKAMAKYEAARAKFGADLAKREDEARDPLMSSGAANGSEGPVRGYNLLGPDLPETQAPTAKSPDTKSP